MQDLYIRIMTGLALGVLASTLFLIPSWLSSLICVAILIRILLQEWPRLLKPQDPLFWLIMPFYPILPTLLFIYMQLYGYEILNLMLICLVTAHDTGAYLIGTQWGKHPIEKEVSPHKSWEGFIGGTACSFLCSLIFFGHNPVALILGSVFPLALSIKQRSVRFLYHIISKIL